MTYDGQLFEAMGALTNEIKELKERLDEDDRAVNQELGAIWDKIKEIEDGSVGRYCG